MRLECHLKWRTLSTEWGHPALQDLDNCTIVGGFLYFHGGRETGRPKFYVYSLKDETWSAIKGALGHWRHEAVLVDDKLFLLGGQISRWNLRLDSIKVYDLLLDSSQVVCDHINCSGSTVYIERRRALCIVRGLQSRGYVTLFNVDTLQHDAVLVKGEFVASHRFTALEYAGSVFIHGNWLGGTSVLGVLTFNQRNMATFSRVLTLKPRTGVQMQLVNGMVLGFGGRRNGIDSEDMLVFNPRTQDYVEASAFESSSLKHEGIWPASGAFKSVSFNGKLLLLGGRHYEMLMQLEFCPVRS